MSAQVVQFRNGEFVAVHRLMFTPDTSVITAIGHIAQTFAPRPGDKVTYWIGETNGTFVR